ncbi:MAG: hypothetical protein ABR573_03055 [Candidatus Dormibacteria bacterium]
MSTRMGARALAGVTMSLSLSVLVGGCGSASRPAPIRTDYSYGSAFETPTPAQASPTANAGPGGTVIDVQPTIIYRPGTRTTIGNPPPGQYPSPKPIPTRPFLSVHLDKPQLPYSTGSRDDPYEQTISVVAEIDAAISVLVTYADGKTTHGGSTGGSASGGVWSDSWKIDSTTPQGTARILLTASGSERQTWSGTFEVTDGPPHVAG